MGRKKKEPGNKNEIVVHKGGRPSKYREEFPSMAFKYCLLGADNKMLARLFGVVESTIDKWIAEIPEFSGAVKDGRVEADANVANSLYFKAKGYQEIKVSNVLDVNGVIIGKKEEIIMHQPDTMCMIYWLNNRQRQYWQAKNVEIEKQKIDIEKQKLEMARQKQEFEMQIARERLELEKLKASQGDNADVEDDGFIEALNESASEVWESDADEDIQEGI